MNHPLIQSLLTIANTERGVLLAGFCIGFFGEVRLFRSETYDRPLGCILDGCISGTMCALGANLLDTYFLPQDLRLVISAFAIIATLRNQFKKKPSGQGWSDPVSVRINI
jgi:hypothetical protein